MGLLGNGNFFDYHGQGSAGLGGRREGARNGDGETQEVVEALDVEKDSAGVGEDEEEGAGLTRGGVFVDGATDGGITILERDWVDSKDLNRGG